MARQQDSCWRCGTEWATEDKPRTTRAPAGLDPDAVAQAAASIEATARLQELTQRILYSGPASRRRPPAVRRGCGVGGGLLRVAFLRLPFGARQARQGEWSRPCGSHR
jgi:hypothetical protein